MAENAASKTSPKDHLTSMREQLGQDGHPVENAVSLIVSQAASVRGLFSSPIEANFALGDALAGKKK